MHWKLWPKTSEEMGLDGRTTTEGWAREVSSLVHQVGGLDQANALSFGLREKLG